MQTVAVFLLSILLSLALWNLIRVWLFFWGRRALLRGNPGGARRLRGVGNGVCVVLGLVGLVKPEPIWGLLVLFFIPAGFEGATALGRTFSRRRLDDSGLAYFHALQGLVHSGLGLSTALFRLARAQPTDFAQAMAKSLGAFEEGKSLAACLDKFHRRVPSPLLGATLRSLQMAYRQGLPVAPILDQMVPALEAEADQARRISDLRHSAFAQASVAFLVPWVLVAASCAFRPEGGVILMSSVRGLGLVICALAVEAMGVILLWQASRFA